MVRFHDRDHGRTIGPYNMSDKRQKHWIPFEWIRNGDRIEFMYGREQTPTTGTVKILNSQQRSAVVHITGSSGARPAIVGSNTYLRCLISEAKRKERTALAAPWWMVWHPLTA